MNRRRTRSLPTALLLALVLPVASAASAADAPKTATAAITGLDGEVLGSATLTEAPNGVLLNVGFEGLPTGVHAFHIHAVGKCEPAGGFQSAGGHFNPTGKKHGLMSVGGPHLGDLPNVHTPGNMSFAYETFVPGLTLAEGEGTLFDADGSSLVVHDHADDYVSDPAGAAGSRIGCGVIRK
ncbi:MAG: superoxide dismutase family protein [Deltaproteobacteria bacterium]|nr:superoxide dismutase family protein [Deltaproteobacteria bacterium]